MLSEKSIIMRNSFFLLCAVLLVEGVSSDVDVEVPVLKGDSVTLKPDNTVTLQKDDWIRWKCNGTLISKMKKTGEDFSIITDFTPDEKFRGRLEPNNTTGSLKITDITKEHAGDYQVEMKSKTETFKSYRVTVSDNVKSISVLKGDSVTLHTGATKKQGDQILWKIGAEILNGDVDYTITNICQTGDYGVEIQTSNTILNRKFPINCSDEERAFSVMEEQPITLDTGLIEIQGYDQILWKVEGQIIAEINQMANKLSYHDSKRFKGRLQVNEKSGSLTINKTNSTDSGVFQLQMNSRSHTLQRNISVNVSRGSCRIPQFNITDSDSSGAVSGIYSASFGLVVWAVTVSLLQV